MRIGQLRNRVTLQEPIVVEDALGGRSTTFQNVRKVWARVLPGSATEMLVTDQKQHVITHTVVIRFFDRVIPKWRVLFNQRELEIDSLRNVDETGRFIEMTCLERHV